MFENATDIRSLIPVEYRMFYISHTSHIQFDVDLVERNVIHIGLCFPKLCTDNDANEIGDKILSKNLQKNRALFGNVQFKYSISLSLRDNFNEESFVRVFK
jgi:hypothetical protein